jgi:DNA-directed RNA polymerase specialized sigma24 family protein
VRSPKPLHRVHFELVLSLIAAIASSVAIRHVLGTAGDARDCVHDALIRVWSKEGAYRPGRGALRSFLIVCVRNEAISRKRSDVGHVANEQRAAGATPIFGIDTAGRPDGTRDPATVELVRIRLFRFRSQ